MSAQKKRMEAGKLVPLKSRGGEGQIMLTDPEKIVVAEKICKKYAKGKYTLKSCCEYYYISLNRFKTWAAPGVDLVGLLVAGEPLPKGAVPAIQEMYDEAHLQAESNYFADLKDSARVGLFKKVEGYDYEETTEEYTIDAEPYLKENGIYKTDDEGKLMPNPEYGTRKLVSVKVKKMHKDADTTAIIHALNNVDGANFTDRKKVTLDIPGMNKSDKIKELSDEDLERQIMENEMRVRKLQKGAENIDFEEVK